jgi:hypothetical protein
MPKAKKKRIEAVEAAYMSELMGEDVGATAEEQERLPPPQPPDPHPPSPPSPGAAQRERANCMVKFFSEKRDVAEAVATKLKSELKMVRRLYNAKQKRWESTKNHRGQRKLKKPITEVCRIYESIIAVNNAEIKSLLADMRLAERENEVSLCLMRVWKLLAESRSRV